MTRTLTAIVLQGGGALGAYEFGLLKALFERPGFQPDVVTGVSISQWRIGDGHRPVPPTKPLPTGARRHRSIGLA